MSNLAKRQCRRIDKALTELDNVLSVKGANARSYHTIHSILQFLLKEYCQSINGLSLLSKTDFKDYFLIIISYRDLPSDIANVLLSMLYNASRLDELFDDLTSSTIFDAVTNTFLQNPNNYSRSLRFLSLSMYKDKTSFQFPLRYLSAIMSYCNTGQKLPARSERASAFSEVAKFLPAYIKKQVTSDWPSFLEENDIASVLATLNDIFVLNKKLGLLNPPEVYEIAKISMSIVIHEETPMDVANSFKEMLSLAIHWFSSERSIKSLELLLSLYHQGTLQYICYLSEKERNSIFNEILFPPYTPTFRQRVLKIYLHLCQEGSYRTQLVDRTFCNALIALMNEEQTDQAEAIVLQYLKVYKLVVSIFFTFNSGEKLVQIAINSGLYSSLLSLTNYISVVSVKSDKIFTECQSLIPKTFMVLHKMSDHKLLDNQQYKVFLDILKRFRSINCLNYLLYLSLTVDITHLSIHSFVSLIFHELNCATLSIEDQYFDNKPLRSAPGSLKKITSLPQCGKMIISNVLQNLNLSVLTLPWVLSESFILLRKRQVIKVVLEYDVVNKMLGKILGDCNLFANMLTNLCLLIHWMDTVLGLDLVAMYHSNSTGSIELISETEIDCFPISITNGESQIVINKATLINCSSVFKNMFEHNFRESLESCIQLPYLSNETLICLKTFLTGNRKSVSFSDVSDLLNFCYPWSVALELIPFSTMFMLTDVYEKVSSSLHNCKDKNVIISVCKLSFKHNYPLWLLTVSHSFSNVRFDKFEVSLEQFKSFFRKLFYQVVKPLLIKFSESEKSKS